MTTLESTVRHEGELAVVQLSGDIDATGEQALEAAWVEAAHGQRVLVHFGDVDYINSTGIALIVGLLARARAEGIEVRACGLSPHYREIFEITRLSDFMTIFADERSARGAGAPGGDGTPDSTNGR